MVFYDSTNKQDNVCLIGEIRNIKAVELQCGTYVNGAYYPVIDR